MANLSILKARRLKNREREQARQIIVFELGSEFFALPIVAVKKVIHRSETQGDTPIAEAGLTVYDGKELLVLDPYVQIFGSAPGAAEQTTYRYLMIVCDRSGEQIGLPLVGPPSVQRIAQSAVSPLPANYAARVNMQCVLGIIVQPDRPILFLLNPEQLIYHRPPSSEPARLLPE